MANQKEVFHSYEKESNKDWGTTASPDYNLTKDQIQTGCILRIAKATEAMAVNHVKLQSELDYYKNRYSENIDKIEYLKKSNAALRGHLTRLRTKVFHQLPPAPIPSMYPEERSKP